MACAPRVHARVQWSQNRRGAGEQRSSTSTATGTIDTAGGAAVKEWQACAPATQHAQHETIYQRSGALRTDSPP
jgi:hypothetical protein